jgi:hypothetical protein
MGRTAKYDRAKRDQMRALTARTGPFRHGRVAKPVTAQDEADRIAMAEFEAKRGVSKCVPGFARGVRDSARGKS